MPLRSGLLELPAELRNTIYERIASSTTNLKFYADKLAEHPLALASKQLMAEFQPVYQLLALSTVSNIAMHLAELVFRPALSVVPLLLATHPRTVNIKIHLRDVSHCYEWNMTEWLEFVDEAEQDGRALDMTYEMLFKDAAYSGKKIRLSHVSSSSRGSGDFSIDPSFYTMSQKVNIFIWAIRQSAVEVFKREAHAHGLRALERNVAALAIARRTDVCKMRANKAAEAAARCGRLVESRAGRTVQHGVTSLVAPGRANG